jgi:uncharacterized protein (DUF433 family)
MTMLGSGIYTPAEAAALLRQRPRTVRRWAFGYARERALGRVAHPPLIATRLPELEGSRALTFVELVELLYVRAFNEAGVSWPAIRSASRTASRLFHSDHPFALRRFYVDPAGVYAAIGEEDGSESLVHLAGHGQHSMTQLVRPYLAQLEFDACDVASRWWPLGKSGGVVIDPHRSFGAPVVEEAGIRTRVLSDAAEAERGERSVERVAWMYEVEPRHVDAALGFERWLRSA